MGCLSNWLVRSCVICLLLFGTVACGTSAPRSVVDNALQYEIAHAGEAPNPLVGIEDLERWSQVRAVNVQAQKSIDVRADGQLYPGLAVRGTYSLTVRSPNRKSRYKRTEPFVLTLVHLTDPATDSDRWLLARSQKSTANASISDRASAEWTLIDFAPAPSPESPPDLTEPDEEIERDESASPSSRSNPSQLSSEEALDIVGVFETLEE